jgi:DNA repair protein RadA/Sms
MKTKSVWYCQSCGTKHVRWSGQCSGCQGWNCLQEEAETTSKPAYESVVTKLPQKPLRLSEIQNRPLIRNSCNIKEFDRLIGGGIVPGSLMLLGGDPGIGKSTLSLQLALQCAQQKKTVLYVSGEESLEQTSMRAKRLDVNSEYLYFLSETEVGSIVRHAEAIKPSLLIIDSIQIVYKGELQSAPGSVSQVREAASTFMQLAKQHEIATVLIGHVTKSGEIAGPKVLEHLVDTVLYFEGDKQQNLRLLRVVKNRFGPTDEIAIFQMRESGLHAIENPSQVFLQERGKASIGSCVIPTIEGSRPFLIEAQSLVTDTYFTTPSRRASGFDPNRLQLLLAVAEKKAKLQLYKCDVFVSSTGGMRLQEPACDLGIFMAICSSFCNRIIDPSTLVIGEVGLNGEVRGVTRIEQRLKEGAHMGFRRAIIPKRNLASAQMEVKEQMEVFPLEGVEEALDLLMH